MSRTFAFAALPALALIAACGQNASDSSPEPSGSIVADAALETLEENAAAVEDFAASIEAAGETAATEDGIADAEAAMVGTEAGNIAPEITALNTNGETFTFDALSGAAGTVLVFTRSVDWCPFCQKQLVELKAAEDALAAEGWGLAAISYDAPDSLKTFAAKQEISYTLLSDTDSETIKRWGLLNEEMPEGTKYFGIPHPTIAYIGLDGTLLQIDTNTDYKVRPSTADVIEAATALSNAG